jgi:hypothetical protein
LQHVDHLRDVAHVQLVGLAVEDVQAHAGRHRAAHGGLLPQGAVAILVLLRNAIPHAPFIEEETDLRGKVVAIEQARCSMIACSTLGKMLSCAIARAA